MVRHSGRRPVDDGSYVGDGSVRRRAQRAARPSRDGLDARERECLKRGKVPLAQLVQRNGGLLMERHRDAYHVDRIRRGYIVRP